MNAPDSTCVHLIRYSGREWETHFAPNDGWQFTPLEVAYVKLGYAADMPDLPDERGRQLDEHMPVKVTFTEVCAATRQASEDANLVFADQCLAAVLVPTEHGWFMQAGFGPCNHEAIFFDTLSSAAEWVQERFAE